MDTYFTEIIDLCNKGKYEEALKKDEFFKTLTNRKRDKIKRVLLWNL